MLNPQELLFRGGVGGRFFSGLQDWGSWAVNAWNPEQDRIYLYPRVGSLPNIFED